MTISSSPVKSRILVYDPTGRAEIALAGGFKDQYYVDFARTQEAARVRLTTRHPNVVITALPHGMPFSLLEEANLLETRPIVVVAATANEGGRIAEAFDRGAVAYVPMPLDRRVVSRVVERELKTAHQRSEVEELRSQLEWDDVRIPGSSLEDIEKVAILRSLQASGGSTGRAARMLGISVRKIQYRLREWRQTEPESLPAEVYAHHPNSAQRPDNGTYERDSASPS